MTCQKGRRTDWRQRWSLIAYHCPKHLCIIYQATAAFNTPWLADTFLEIGSLFLSSVHRPHPNFFVVWSKRGFQELNLPLERGTVVRPLLSPLLLGFFKSDKIHMSRWLFKFLHVPPSGAGWTVGRHGEIWERLICARQVASGLRRHLRKRQSCPAKGKPITFWSDLKTLVGNGFFYEWLTCVFLEVVW
jgi:hypothetical protein